MRPVLKAIALVGSVGAVTYLAGRRRDTVPGVPIPRGPLGGLGDIGPDRWWQGRPPREAKVCYRTKTDAMRAFLAANADIVQLYKGPDATMGPAEFDSINRKYREGKKPARSIADAVWAALPPQVRPPYCLTDIDLEALNDTSPALGAEQALGVKFQLPDAVFEEEQIWPDELPPDPPPPDWRRDCELYQYQEREWRRANADDCYKTERGVQCRCRDNGGRFRRCPLPGHEEAPF